MTNQEAICPKCSGPARVTRTLDERAAGIFTNIHTVCLSATCGEQSTLMIPGDHR